MHVNGGINQCCVADQEKTFILASTPFLHIVYKAFDYQVDVDLKLFCVTVFGVVMTCHRFEGR